MWGLAAIIRGMADSDWCLVQAHKLVFLTNECAAQNKMLLCVNSYWCSYAHGMEFWQS